MLLGESSLRQRVGEEAAERDLAERSARFRSAEHRFHQVRRSGKIPA